MSGTDGTTPWSARRRWTVFGSLAVLILVVVVALVVASIAQRSAPGGAASPSPSTGPTAGASPEPTATATGEPTPVEPPATAEPAPEPREPVGLDDTVEDSGLAFSIASLEAVDGTAGAPGEIAGPSLRVTVAVRNDTDAPASLATAIVNVEYGPDRTPAIELQEPGGRAFPTEVDAGSTATGVFVFNVPPEARDLVRVTVDYSVDIAPVLFEGSAPR